MENTEAWRKTCFFFKSTRVEGIPSMCQVWGPTDLWACPFQVSALRWWPSEGQGKPSPEKGARALGILAVSPEIRVLWSLGYFISQGIPFRLTGRLTTSSGAVQSALKHPEVITCWWTQDLLGSTNRSLKKRPPCPTLGLQPSGGVPPPSAHHHLKLVGTPPALRPTDSVERRDTVLFTYQLSLPEWLTSPLWNSCFWTKWGQW